jgi:hypothetical protein
MLAKLTDNELLASLGSLHRDDPWAFSTISFKKNPSLLHMGYTVVMSTVVVEVHVRVCSWGLDLQFYSTGTVNKEMCA